MANPNKPKFHMVKGHTLHGTVIALCGREVHSHTASKDAVLVSCVNCLKQLRK